MACIWALAMVVVINHNYNYRKEIQAMKKYTTVMADLLSIFPRSEFEDAISDFSGDRRTRTLGCFDLLKSLLYGQVIGAFSVREIESSLAINATRLYHCGMKPVRRSTLCDAMGCRDPRIFERAFEGLVGKANRLSSEQKLRFKNPLKIIDATTIDVCLNRFEWAKFRTTKGAIKLHVAINGDGCFPEQVHLTNGDVHEVGELSSMHFARGDIVVMDRGYLDYNRLRHMDLREVCFVTRLKSNSDVEIVTTIAQSTTEAVRGDYRIKLRGIKSRESYSAQLRMVAYHDEEHDRDYRFVTNNFELAAQEIADIYKARWQIELFFKWIKQNLKIKTFWGTSQNAVRIQIWAALILYLLLWIKKAMDGIGVSLQRLLQILKTTILGKGTMDDLFRMPCAPPDSLLSDQLLFEALL
jgi:hypothetical protein